nr:hypothetical protein [Candidatus Sigynarchaeota archaeon]
MDNSITLVKHREPDGRVGHRARSAIETHLAPPGISILVNHDFRSVSSDFCTAASRHLVIRAIDESKPMANREYERSDKRVNKRDDIMAKNNIEYEKAQKTTIHDQGYDENWLKDKICEDPSILGLGNLTKLDKERRQSSGGKLDLLFQDQEMNVIYEVEVQLGKTDESHIIRTIEYWDNEKRKNPTYDHRAVIIAEEITNRFFNVIMLFNRAIPIIAIQLNTLIVNNKMTLDFQKVLDITEAPENEIDSDDLEPCGKSFWDDDDSFKDSLLVCEKMKTLVSTLTQDLFITKNKNHFALGTSKRNFLWCTPRKSKKCFFEQLILDSNVDQVKQLFESVEISPNYKKSKGNYIVLAYAITEQSLTEYEKMFKDLINITLTFLT